MFDIAPSELVLVGAVALVVIGPKDLPRAMHFVGKWVGRARGMARHFRSGLDEIVRQAELEEMQKTWAAENARIMAEHPLPPPEEEQHDALYAAAPVMKPLPKPVENDPQPDFPGVGRGAGDANAAPDILDPVIRGGSEGAQAPGERG